MADLTLKQNDTYPYLRGKALDEEGTMDLTEADSIKVILKSGATVIEGEVEVLESDPEGYTWQYKWAEGDTEVLGEYKAEIEITWDAEGKKVQTIPNGTYATVEIVDDLA